MNFKHLFLGVVVSYSAFNVSQVLAATTTDTPAVATPSTATAATSAPAVVTPAPMPAVGLNALPTRKPLPDPVQQLIKNNPNLIARISPLSISCVQGKDCANAAKDLAPPEPGKARAGDAIYDAVCSTCHKDGLLGAPKLGSSSDWSARVAKGMTTLYQHAIAGFNAMPARGGNATLSDEEVKNAVDYMTSKSK